MARIPGADRLPDVNPGRDPGLRLPDAVIADAYGHDVTTATARFGAVGANLLEDLAKERQHQEDSAFYSTAQTRLRVRVGEMERALKQEIGAGAPNYAKTFQERYQKLSEEVEKEVSGELAGSSKAKSAYRLRAGEMGATFIGQAALYEDGERKAAYVNAAQGNIETIAISAYKGDMPLDEALRQAGQVLADADKSLLPGEKRKVEDAAKNAISVRYMSGLAERNPSAALGIIKKTPAATLADWGLTAKDIDSLDNKIRTEMKRGALMSRIEKALTANKMADANAKANREGAYVLPDDLKAFNLAKKGWKDAEIKSFYKELEANTLIGETNKAFMSADADDLAAIRQLYTPDVTVGVEGYRLRQGVVAAQDKLLAGSVKHRGELAAAIYQNAAAGALSLRKVVEPGSQERVSYETGAPSKEDWMSSVAPLMGTAFAEATYQSIESMSAATKRAGGSDKLPAILEKAGTKAMTPDAINRAVGQHFAKLEAERATKMKENPGDYVDAHSPVTREAKLAWAENAGQPSGPLLMRDYLEKNLQTQVEMGVIDPRLPKSFTDNFQQRWDATSGEGRTLLLSETEKALGRLAPKFLADLQKSENMSSDLRTIAINPLAPQARVLAELSGAKLDELKKRLKDEGDAKDIDDKVRANLNPLMSTIGHTTGPLGSAMYDSAMKLAMFKRQQGASLSESARWATEMMTEPYNFYSLRGGYVRVPKDVPASGLAMERFIATFSGPVDPAFDYAAERLTREQAVEAYVRSTQAKGRIVAAEGDRGFYVFNGARAVTYRGEKILYPWSVVQRGNILGLVPVKREAIGHGKIKETYSIPGIGLEERIVPADEPRVRVPGEGR